MKKCTGYVLRSQCAWLALVVAPLAAAQEAPEALAISDTTPFRRGQWAAQFGGGFSLASLGVLRFTSSRSAWVLDVRVSGGHGHSDYTSPVGTGDTTISRFTSGAAISFRAGRRFYRSAGRRIVRFLSLGLLGGFAHEAAGSEPGGTFEENGWSAGTFGDLGGTYLLHQHVGIGVTGDVAVTYNRSRFRSSNPQPSTGTTWSYSVSGPNLRFVATLFF